jgi:hypothetical protein
MPKSVKYEVYIPSGMTPQIEAYCNETSMSASEAFREAMKAELETEGYL